MSITALVLAAGNGTRMKSEKPKVTHEVMGVPMVNLVVEAARNAGAGRVIVVTGHQSELVCDCLNKCCCAEYVETVYQADRCGTANAVQLIEGMLTEEERKGTLVVLAGDVPLIRPETIRTLVDDCVSSNAAMSVLTAKFKKPAGYGRIMRDTDDHVVGIVEDKDATPEELKICETNTGTYAFALDGLFERLRRISNDNAKGEYYLTDIVKVCCDDGLTVRAMRVKDTDETKGVNDRAQLAGVSAALHKRITRRWMAEGVTLISPKTTWIGPHVTIDSDVEIWPNTYLRGHTRIGKGSTIGPDSRVVDSTVGEQVTIDSSIVLESEVGDFCSIGPRSYLRPGCKLETGAKVGTSCELKNAHLKAGAKVPHLSYIGDATIGKSTNIGAGVITCNYDGFKKSRTEVGDNAFVGSDVMLVAPVAIGDGAIVGAGSVISRDVPADAMALERSDQRNEEGMAKFLREMSGGDV
ncbi:MAG: bifunctional UDP-N-acetylglucosamine diphosphorylase/glucosamine-1-phosphate N-acetyltransferase GlmU [Coriobacteriia bacterium]|nr:bifunctional UDP-N-acetylglucosamine diphosphorylase/glucosamine-1-phosphate N-acetyltransferase GlmU [Coriobacteriia bacterium]